MTANILQSQPVSVSPKPDASTTSIAKPPGNGGLADASVDKGAFSETMEQALESYSAEDALAADTLLPSEQGKLLPLNGNNLPLDKSELADVIVSAEIKESDIEPDIDGDEKLYINELISKKESQLGSSKISNTEKTPSGLEVVISNSANQKESSLKRDGQTPLSKTSVELDLSQKSEFPKQFQIRNEALTGQDVVREIPPMALLQNKSNVSVPVLAPVVKIAESLIASKTDVKSIMIAEETLSNINLTSALKTDAASSAKGLPVVTVASSYTSNVWGDELSNSVRYLVGKNIQNAEIKINPQNLGPIEIKISMVNEQTNVQFISQFPQVREALEQAMPRLRDMLGESGVELGDADVSQDSFDNNQNNQEKLNSEFQSNYALDDGGEVDTDGVITTTVNIQAESTIDYYV